MKLLTQLGLNGGLDLVVGDLTTPPKKRTWPTAIEIEFVNSEGEGQLGDRDPNPLPFDIYPIDKAQLTDRYPRTKKSKLTRSPGTRDLARAGT